MSRATMTLRNRRPVPVVFATGGAAVVENEGGEYIAYTFFRVIPQVGRHFERRAGAFMSEVTYDPLLRDKEQAAPAETVLRNRCGAATSRRKSTVRSLADVDSVGRDRSRKGAGDHTVPLVVGMNIEVAAANPGIGTDVGVRCWRTAEGAKDINDGETKGSRIRGEHGVKA